MSRALPTYSIDSDEALCGVLCDLTHALKVRPRGGICDEFAALVADFIVRHELGHDPQAFASLPEPNSDEAT